MSAEQGRTYKYTFETEHGDVDVTTAHHYSWFGSIEDFIRHHQAVIQDTLGVAQFVLATVIVHRGHGRGGNEHA
jgi:hypothetical protein